MTVSRALYRLGPPSRSVADRLAAGDALRLRPIRRGETILVRLVSDRLGDVVPLQVVDAVIAAGAAEIDEAGVIRARRPA